MERLNKYLAHAGIGSRRHCDTLIAGGRVKVDGKIVRELGIQINPATHQIAVDDHPVQSEKFVYWLVNKPAGYLCTNSDPAGRPRAIDLLPHVDQRVYAVGRLDEASEGLLLMTNDGELAYQLMHPRHGVTKTYLVQVAGRPAPEDVQKLLDGVWLAEGKVRAKFVRRLKGQGNSTWLRIVLSEGKNREIRRMLAKLDHKVLQLRRVAIGPIALDKLPRGKARKLTAAEQDLLRKDVAASQKRATRGEKDESSPQGETPEPRRNPMPRKRPFTEHSPFRKAGPGPVPKRVRKEGPAPAPKRVVSGEKGEANAPREAPENRRKPMPRKRPYGEPLPFRKGGPAPAPKRAARGEKAEKRPPRGTPEKSRKPAPRKRPS